MGRRAGPGLALRLILLVALAIAPAFGLVVYTANEHSTEAIHQAQEDALRTGRSIAFEHQQWVNEIQQLLIAASDFPLTSDGERAVCDQFAEELVAQNPRYNTFQVVDAEGQYLCNLHPPIDGQSPLQQGWFQGAMETRQFAVGDYQVDSTGNAGLVFAYPLLASNGADVTHVMALSVSLAWVNERAAQADLPPDSTMTLVDRNGTVLARYPDPESWVGSPVADVPSVAAAINQETEGTARGVRGLNEGARLYGFVPFGLLSDEQALRVIVGIPEHVAFAQVESTFQRNLLGLASAFALSLGAAWFFGEVFVMRQVRALVDASKRLAGGDFSTRTAWRGTGELAQVASAFDQMAEALEEREAERAKAEEQRLELARAQAARTSAEAGQQRLRALVDTSPVAVFVVEVGTGQLVLANLEARRMYGVSEVEEITAQYLASVVRRRPDGSVYTYEETPMARALLNGETTRAEDMVLEFPDGRTVPALVSATPILRGDGSIEASLLVVQDMSRLAEAERLKSEFLSMVSHELRSPMVAVKSAVNLLRYEESASAPEVQELLDSIDTDADRLLNLVSNLLDMAQIEAGAFSVSPQTLDLGTVLEKSVHHFSVTRSFPVDLHSPAGLPYLEIDPERIGQVIDNLLANASRFALSGTRVTVDVQQTEDAITVSVRNRGPIIPADEVSQLFKKFGRVGRRHTRHRMSTGLGLSICKGIIEAHGGRIWVESNEAREETTFSFSLPIDHAHSVAA